MPLQRFQITPGYSADPCLDAWLADPVGGCPRRTLGTLTLAHGRAWTCVKVLANVSQLMEARVGRRALLLRRQADSRRLNAARRVRVTLLAPARSLRRSSLCLWPSRDNMGTWTRGGDSSAVPCW